MKQKEMLRKNIQLVKGIILIELGVFFYFLSRTLPEWMAGMLLVGGIVLHYCIDVVLGNWLDEKNDDR